MHVGTVVIASKSYTENNPEYKAAYLLEKEGVEVSGIIYEDKRFVEIYPEVNPATNVVIFCGGVRYDTVKDFMSFYNKILYWTAARYIRR